MKLTYEGVVSICEAHGIGLPVDCIEMVMAIAEYAGSEAVAAHKSEGADIVGKFNQSRELPGHNTELAKEVAKRFTSASRDDGRPENHLGWFLGGKSVSAHEYIQWISDRLAKVEEAKIPPPKYYGGSAEEGDQHEIKCAYVDGWNECREAIAAASATGSGDA